MIKGRPDGLLVLFPLETAEVTFLKSFQLFSEETRSDWTVEYQFFAYVFGTGATAPKIVPRGRAA